MKMTESILSRMLIQNYKKRAQRILLFVVSYAISYSIYDNEPRLGFSKVPGTPASHRLTLHNCSSFHTPTMTISLSARLPSKQLV